MSSTWRVFLILLAVSLNLVAKPASADVYWSSVAAACMPESQAVQSAGYVTSSNTGAVAPSGTRMAVLVCPVLRRTNAPLPSILGLTYRDSTGTASTAQVRAQLIRVNRLTGVRSSLATVNSDSTAATGIVLRYSPAFVHQLNFETALYFVRIELTRSTTAAAISAIGVALESTCGNGAVTAPEQCDDANRNDGDGCSASCAIETGFQCSGAPSTCTAIAGFCTSVADCAEPGNECKTPVCTGNNCGFSFTPAGTETSNQTSGNCRKQICDGAGGITETADGTDIPNNSNECMIASCTGGTPALQPKPAGTVCSSGGGSVCDGAGTCIGLGVCGDGLLSGSEACDDGNLNGSDGCSSSCTIESGFSCTGSPSTCTSICGNGIIDAGEECDGANLNGNSCVTQGFTTGSLSCAANCTFNTSACRN